MLLSCITHADARDKAHAFRGLTERGRIESIHAAARFSDLARTLETEHGEPIPPISRIVSSPKARCLETVILFSKALGDRVDTSEIQVDDRITAGSVIGHELAELGKGARVEHLLVSGHADLAKTLPGHVKLVPGVARDGWFSARPILFTVRHESVTPWESARMLFCLGLHSDWRNLLDE